jgi:hypothetical protein
MPRRLLAVLVVVVLLLGSLVGTLHVAAYGHEHDDHTGHDDHDMTYAFALPEFERTWARTDEPVAAGQVGRTWMWGRGPNTAGIEEQYADAPDGKRWVQYFDKSRMEDNRYRATNPWDVTNALLVNEMLDGKIQVGDAEFIDHTHGPSTENVAGDPTDTEGPTYRTMAGLRDEPAATDGATIDQMIDHDGTITRDASLAAMGVTAAWRVTVDGIDHQVASVFVEFMRSTGIVYVDGAFIIDQLFLNEVYATGYPVTEAYWAQVLVDGTRKLVLIQCFERRCLTYTPDNEPGWRVEAGNVGQHYYRWRMQHEEPQRPAESLFFAELTGAAERPNPVATLGLGSAFFFLSDDGETLHFQIEIERLENVTMGHIHTGGVDGTGPPVVWLYPVVGASGAAANPPGDFTLPTTLQGQITDDDVGGGMSLWDLVEMMIAGNTYVNFHTTAYPAGEIRGQIAVLETANFAAELTNEQEVVADPGNQPATGATGNAWLRYERGHAHVECDIEVADIINVTMAHIHVAPAGSNGPVVTWLFPADGAPANPAVTPDSVLPCESVTRERVAVPPAVAAQIDGTSLEAVVYQMLIGNAYVNIHTTAYPPGEIRGQIAWTELYP